MHLPQLIIIILYASSWGVSLSHNGERRRGTYSAGGSFLEMIIMFGILYWGGFFR